jgi:serine/threonine-protein kinase
VTVEDDKPTVIDPLVLPSSSLRAVPPPGTRIGQYVVERLLGVGGMGVVVAAKHAHLGETVAIKLMHAKAAKNDVQAQRFAREAKQTSRIKSERVVRVTDAGMMEDTGAPYIVMEYLEGRDLARVLSEDGPLHPTVCADLMLQVCEALAAAHALGIVHRDLKPSNFFLTTSADGSPLVKVLDFGISKALAPEGIDSAKLTETQAVFGSPTYMSPEQIRSSTNVDQRSDVWSLGVAMFELLTGKLPFIADNVAGLLASIVADQPFLVSTFAPGVPPQLEAVVLGCLQKDVNARVQSVAVLAGGLKPFASSSAEAAAITGRIERIVRSSVPSMTRSFPPPVGSSRPSAPAPALDFSKTTGTDLISSGDVAKRMRGGGLATIIAAALGGALLVVGAIAAIVFVRTRNAPAIPADATNAAGPPPAASIAPPTTTSPSPPVLTEPSTAAVPSSSVAAKPGMRGKTRPPVKPTSAGAAPPPTPPAPAPNPDTTGSRD